MAKSEAIDFKLEEWKEARDSVKKFDGYLIDLRKYGFSLATILLGADAFLSFNSEIPMLPWTKAVVAIVVMILILALFILDNHVRILLESALGRAVRLEGRLRPARKSSRSSRDNGDWTLSQLRQQVINRWEFTKGGKYTYFLFHFATGLVGIVSICVARGTAPLELLPLLTLIVTWVSMLSMTIFYYWMVTWKLGYLWRPKLIAAKFEALISPEKEEEVEKQWQRIQEEH